MKCTPVDPSNNCYVILGGVSVTLKDNDSLEIKQEILDEIKDTMNGGDLLSEDQSDVKNITYIGEYEEKEEPEAEVVVERGSAITSDPEAGSESYINQTIIGAAVAAMVLFIAFLIRRKKHDEVEVAEDDSPFGVVAFAGVTNDGSFIAPDSDDLGKQGSAMDVHQCTSQTCAKCYQANRLRFIPVGGKPKQGGAFAHDISCIEVVSNTRQLSCTDEDEDSVQTCEFS